VLLANSGGPVTSTAAVLVGWGAWPLRRRLRLVRRVAVVVLLLLIVFMKAPIWYLPFKISSLVGGGGYHRGLLMERAWQELGTWWLVGMDNKETAAWFPYILDVVGGADVTNQFLVFALSGGLTALAFCIGLLTLAFRRLGIALSVARARSDDGQTHELLLWGLGVTLFVHSVSWLGVSYFDQSWVVWLTHAALVATAVEVKTGVEERVRVAAPERGGPPTPALEPAWRRRGARQPADKSVIVTRRLALSGGRTRADG
jgi:hypothetical protein